MPDGNDNLIEGNRHENVYPEGFEIGNIKPFHPSGEVQGEDSSDFVEDKENVIPFPKPQDKKPVA